ncbi:hypothetical protein SAMN05216574_11855 [Blastococcus tunisiensis]|uniref:Uncharacterized protein n=1 Tax=Blastococcus tunisiensis TaxID=1798228 RepID=A0A1I2JYE4_9ACTN|nr:hypothetical protein SAMN05216574_11855 [Blastococcus sp. DSM 46838]
MSMMPPPFSADPSDEGIPAADPGQGAPETAPGFGVEEEEPDVPAGDEDDEGRPATGEPPFHTPDPAEIGEPQPKRPEM